MPKPAKQPKNLSLEPAALEPRERYARLHGTNLSRLVSDYLAALPLGAPVEVRSPAARRLYGAAPDARGETPSREDYREYLAKKYGVA